MENRISASITPAAKAELEAVAANILVLLPFLINLTPAQRKKIRKMATKHTGYVADVFNAVIANPTAIPATFSIPEYTKDKVLFDDLTYVCNLFETIVEAMRDTLLQLGSELMLQSDASYDYLKRAAKDNAPLSEIVGKIGTAFAGQGKSKNVSEFMVPPKGSVNVDGVVQNRSILNSGNTMLLMKPGADLANKVKGADIQINPAVSVKIPAGYTSIIVINVSETTEGSFSLKIK
jgi:hypothetical protein